MASGQASLVLQHVRNILATQEAERSSDRELLQRFTRQRDESAFTALVRRHGPMVLNVCRRILHHHHDAEDAFQATFLVLARQAAARPWQESVANWLYLVAHRLALKIKAEAERRSLHEARAAVRPPGDPLAAVSGREFCAALDEELGRLSERCRAPLVLCCLEGLTRDEAARQLGWSLGTLKRRLEQGRALLRQRLVRRGFTLSAALGAGLWTEHATQAALPCTLMQSTVRSAVQTVLGGPAPATLVSTRVATLAEGVLRGMGVAKLKIALAVVLAVGVVGVGAGLAFPRGPGAKPAEETQPEPPRPPAQEVGAKKGESGSRPALDVYGDPLPPGAVARMGTVRFRHGNGATVAFAADGKSLLTSGADRTIRHWDIDSGRLLREQRLPHGGYVPMSLLSPDGRLLAYVDGVTGPVCIWDLARNEIQHVFAPPEAGWWDRIAFSLDSKTLVTAGIEGELRVWDVTTGQGRLLSQKSQVATLSFTADGKLMSMKPGIICLWDLAGGRGPTRLTIPDSLAGAVVSPDGRTVAAWSWHNEKLDQGVQFLDATTAGPAKGWRAPDVKQVHQVRFAPDGKTVLVSTTDRILVWDASAEKLLRTLRGGQGYNLTFSPDGKTVAAFGTGNPSHPQGAVLYAWDLATGVPRAASVFEHGHLGEVQGVAFTPDGQMVASSCWEDHSVRLWEAATGRLLRSLSADELAPHALAFSPDGRQLFVGTSAAVIRWDVATGREVARYPLFETDEEGRYHLMVLHLTSDGQRLVALSQNLGEREGKWAIHAWDVATSKRQPIQSLSAEDLWVGYSRLSPDGRLLALPGGSLRDVASGKELFHLSVAGKELSMPVAFSRDGAFLAAGIWQPINQPKRKGTEMVAVQVWELATLQPVARIETGAAGYLAFTPDGRRLIVADPKSLQLWDLVSGRVVASRPAPGRFLGSYGPSFASALAVAANGHSVVTGHADTTVVLWDLMPAHADRPVAPLPAAELESCWTDLAGNDAGMAASALARLAEVPEQAMTLLRDRLRPARAVPASELRRLLAAVDAHDFAQREAATNRLAELGELADPALREALRGQPSPEVRRRLEDLLTEPRTVRSPEARRHLRAIRLLEGISTPQSREVLEQLAKGIPEARLTQEAKASLERLARQPGGLP